MRNPAWVWGAGGGIIPSKAPKELPRPKSGWAQSMARPNLGPPIGKTIAPSPWDELVSCAAGSAPGCAFLSLALTKIPQPDMGQANRGTRPPFFRASLLALAVRSPPRVHTRPPCPFCPTSLAHQIPTAGPPGFDRTQLAERCGGAERPPRPNVTAPSPLLPVGAQLPPPRPRCCSRGLFGRSTPNRKWGLNSGPPHFYFHYAPPKGVADGPPRTCHTPAGLISGTTKRPPFKFTRAASPGGPGRAGTAVSESTGPLTMKRTRPRKQFALW